MCSGGCATSVLPRDSFVMPTGARKGDVLILTKEKLQSTLIERNKNLSSYVIEHISEILFETLIWTTSCLWISNRPFCFSLRSGLYEEQTLLFNPTFLVTLILSYSWPHALRIGPGPPQIVFSINYGSVPKSLLSSQALSARWITHAVKAERCYLAQKAECFHTFSHSRITQEENGFILVGSLDE